MEAVMFLGRKEELDELNHRYQSNKFEFGIIYGARRIGKTSLIKKFLEDKKHIYFQAKQVSDYDNLASFSKEILRAFHMPLTMVFDSYESALDFIIEQVEDERFILVIDEYPYLNNDKNGFSSYLQNFIDHKALDSKLKVIVSGSNISFMKNELISRGSPLFQRNTFKMNIQRLPFNEAVSFLEGLNNEEKMKYLSIFGGFPYYLAMIEKEKSFEENIFQLLFSRFGTLQDAPDNIMSAATRSQNVYNSILIAIAHRKITIKSIADSIHEEDSKVAKYLITLINSEIVEKRTAFNGSKKMTYYAISDPLIKFWYLFIFDNKDKISMGMGKALFNENIDKINNFIAHAAEDVIISYMTMLNVQGKLKYPYGMIQNYKVDNSILKRSIEIDGLTSYKKHLLVIECKYRKEKFSLFMLKHLKESVSIFANYDDIEYYLFSKSGFTEDLKTHNASNIHLLTLEDLFK